MSRLRKGIKYDGGDFAKGFKNLKNGVSPFGIKLKDYSSKFKEMRDRAKQQAEEIKARAENTADEVKSQASDNSTKSTDLIPPDTDYSRSEVGDFFQRVKLAEERDALEALKGDMEADASSEKEDAYDPNYKDEDGNTVFTDDFDMNMSGKERRKEFRANKKDIRKNTKFFSKGRRKAKKANRQMKRAARKDKRCIKLKNKGKTHKRFYRKNCM
tara:strand:- start:533 stop:1174 length:642 start_codon:yes stop_codon:yes gene_type:complete